MFVRNYHIQKRFEKSWIEILSKEPKNLYKYEWTSHNIPDRKKLNLKFRVNILAELD